MKYFWICLFTFLTFLVVAAAIFRPDTLDGILAYTGLYLAAIGWAFVSLAFLLPIGLAVGGLAVLYVYVKKNHNEWLRPRDGSYPLQRLNPNKPTVIYDPNQQVGSAAVWHPQYGWLEMDGGAGWDRQLAVAAQRALVARAQAANVGDNAIVKSASYMKDAMGGGGSFFRSIRPTAAQQRAIEQAPKGWGDELQGGKIPSPPVSSAPAVLPPRLTLQLAVREATRDKIVFGSQLETGERAVWDLTETPHMRVHGGTQKGKTSAVITVVAGALAQTNQVVVLDPRGFKDWHIAGDYAELVDVRKMEAFVAALASVHEEYLQRDKLLAENNARNISALRGAVRPPRLIVIVEELGAQRFRAKAAGVLEQVDHYMSVLTSEAAASGVHIVAVDQRPSNYHAFVKANLGAVVVFGLPDDAAGKAAGYARAHKLSRYEFAFEGVVYTSVNAAPDFDAIVRASSPIYYPPVVSVRSERSVDRPVDRAEAFGPEVHVSQAHPHRTTERTETEPVPMGPTELQEAVWAWRDMYPKGSQAQLRTAFAEAGLDISKTYAHECWHRWALERMAQFEQGLLNEDQVRALFEAGVIDVMGGPVPGSCRVEREWNERADETE